MPLTPQTLGRRTVLHSMQCSACHNVAQCVHLQGHRCRQPCQTMTTADNDTTQFVLRSFNVMLWLSYEKLKTVL